MAETEKIQIYTDGGCSGNPGAGGWGAVILDGEKEIELSGGNEYTTSNKMELTAAIEALTYAKEHFSNRHIEIFTDSQYVKDGITAWIANWKEKNWMRSKTKEVKNKELWQLLDKLNDTERVSWNWVKGHAGIKYNEVCDELCQKEMAKIKGGKKWKKDISVFIYSNFDPKRKTGEWKAEIIDDSGKKELAGVENAFTVIFTAAITALAYLREHCNGKKAEICTNSEYLKNGNTIWKKAWQRNDWVKADGKPVKYRELWEKLYSLYNDAFVHWKLIDTLQQQKKENAQSEIFSDEKVYSESFVNTFIITEEWLRANTNCGAVNAKQLNAIGLSWPPQNGWLQNMIGKEISLEAKEKFEGYRKRK